MHVLENTELVLYSSYLYIAVTSWVIQNDVDIETVTISNLRTHGHKDSITAAESVKDRLQVVERRAAGLGYIISVVSMEEIIYIILYIL